VYERRGGAQTEPESVQHERPCNTHPTAQAGEGYARGRSAAPSNTVGPATAQKTNTCSNCERILMNANWPYDKRYGAAVLASPPIDVLWPLGMLPETRGSMRPSSCTMNCSSAHDAGGASAVRAGQLSEVHSTMSPDHPRSRPAPATHHYQRTWGPQ